MKRGDQSSISRSRGAKLGCGADGEVFQWNSGMQSVLRDALSKEKRNAIDG